MDTSVLLITFNRPESTRKVLSAIIAAHPKNLYVFQDGAREGNSNDVQKCAEVRKVIEELTKGTLIQLHTYYSDRNLGCGLGPSGAISWFFDNVEQGMIFEDDCLPHSSFFPYCEELLSKYKYDERVGFIGGCNYGFEICSNESYVFGSGHHQTWGWATWKRTWQSFDYYLSDFKAVDFKKIVKTYYKPLRQQEYWMEVFHKVKENQMNASCWDYQLYFSIWKKGMLAVCPSVNLVTNIGSGLDATHTTKESNSLLYQATGNIMPLKHPEKVARNKDIDNYLMKNFIIPYEYGWKGFKRLPSRLNKRLKRFFGHDGSWIKKK